jgi:hypothetical protein
MSEIQQLTFAVWFTALCAIGSLAFFAWLLWSLFWDVYDHLMQQRTRRRNAQFDARVGRDCYRDTKGITR